MSDEGALLQRISELASELAALRREWESQPFPTADEQWERAEAARRIERTLEHLWHELRVVRAARQRPVDTERFARRLREVVSDA